MVDAWRSQVRLSAIAGLSAAALVLSAALARANGPGAPDAPGLVEQLGATVPLGATFRDEEGRDVTLGSLVDRPTVLTLVYYRCPGVCSPLLHEVAEVVGKTGLDPGVDYRLVTVSFDSREGPEIAKRAREELLGDARKPLTPGAWAFLTGDAENVRKLTQAVGFHYAFAQASEDFVHPTAVIFLTKDGKIVRYLNGLKFLPADMKLAVVDASTGRVRGFMRKMERLCYSYDPMGRTYVLKINRIVLAVTIAFAGGFGLFLLVRGRSRGRVESTP